MEMDTQKPTLLQQGMKFGLILGFTQVVVYLLLYVIDKNLMVSFSIAAAIMVVNILLMVLPVRNYKSLIGGTITFKDAFLICLVTIAGGLLITSVFNYVLYNIIDTTLADFIKDSVIEKTASMMEKFGAPQDDIDKQITKLESEDYSQSPSKIGVQYLSGVLFGMLPALIIAAILRTKTKPVDDIQ